ncbi:MAG: hypothetical protein JO250_05500, partial [Armatimonadetes bacterium]|nr:hypothetical protein [Armatimonadota bacterium]
RELARYGQQAWVRHEAGLRITVVGDASLSDDLGGDLLRALSPESEARLARGLDRDFGDGPPQAAPLRRRGWDYAQIAALHLYLQAHPYQKAAVAGRLQHGQDWPRIAADLHADTTRLDENARRWIASTLNVP